jgi:hypothetical protein
MSARLRRGRVAARATTDWLFALGVGASGCGGEPPALVLPTAEQVRSYYTSETELRVEIRGNVAVLTVEQSAAQLRRGGSLWAKVGPYIYLFSEETWRLFDDFSGLAAVRVTTRTAGGQEIATALLVRDELTGVLWRRALNLAGRARVEGTERPGLLEDLVRWGEDHTEYSYSAAFVGR